jgi:hypothetical protein
MVLEMQQKRMCSPWQKKEPKYSKFSGKYSNTGSKIRYSKKAKKYLHLKSPNNCTMFRSHVEEPEVSQRTEHQRKALYSGTNSATHSIENTSLSSKTALIFVVSYGNIVFECFFVKF